MENTRQTLGLGKKAETPKAPQWAVTLTGPTKGMKPVTVVVEAASGKAACAGLKALFQFGKLKVERA